MSIYFPGKDLPSDMTDFAQIGEFLGSVTGGHNGESVRSATHPRSHTTFALAAQLAIESLMPRAPKQSKKDVYVCRQRLSGSQPSNPLERAASLTIEDYLHLDNAGKQVKGTHLLLQVLCKTSDMVELMRYEEDLGTQAASAPKVSLVIKSDSMSTQVLHAAADEAMRTSPALAIMNALDLLVDAQNGTPYLMDDLIPSE